MKVSNHRKNAEVEEVKGSTLKCRLSSGEMGCIHGISFNAKTGREFRVGDQIEVIESHSNENPEDIQLALSKEYVKPLLIFDMHGVLGEREPFKKGRKRRFIRRPHCKEFIKFCAERFEIAVWSCAMKKNIDLTIFEGYPLIFVWTQDEATNLYPNMSIVSDHKPLFLKELSTVWAKFPSYDVTNTILLDNHIEKCERNPLGTCVIVPDFIVENVDDDVIHSEGEIANHLRKMIEAGPSVGLNQYICRHSGTSNLFPITYAPESRRIDPNYIECNKASDSSRGKSEKPTGFIPSNNEAEKLRPTPKEKKHERMLAKIQSLFGTPSVFHFPDENRLSILQPEHLFRENINLVLSGSFLICESISSNNILFVVHSEAKEIYLVFSDSSVHKVQLNSSDDNTELLEWMDDMSGMSIFAGELKRNQSKHHEFKCLDVLLLNDNVVKNESLTSKMARVQGWLLASPLEDVVMLYRDKPFAFKCMNYISISELSAIKEKVSCDESIDGLIFAPEHSSSGCSRSVFKWSISSCRADFSISIFDLRRSLSSLPCDELIILGKRRVGLEKDDMKYEIRVKASIVPKELLRIEDNGVQESEYCVASCEFDVSRNIWNLVKLFRHGDKKSYISHNEASDVEKVTRECITLSDFSPGDKSELQK